jgi:hypothetical protein
LQSESEAAVPIHSQKVVADKEAPNGGVQLKQAGNMHGTLRCKFLEQKRKSLEGNVDLHQAFYLHM